MSGDENETPPPGEDRTVFMPAPGASTPPSGAPGSETPAQASPVEPPAPLQPSSEPPVSYPSQTSAPGFGAGPVGGGEPRRIQVGDVLNHIFEVRRFIARGGMGEVFEGVNVNSDERVAIKGILPHLAADPAVQAMFRKEARTLTRLSHPALVQYRVLAQEPGLGVFYIVTEYIDGQNMSDILKDIQASPAQLSALIKRLAEGLAAAHALGAIHRDISPDNVMLEEGRLERAKVIDFGIAKDLDAGSGTIVGDGFAGKLNYVAPEQLGDFDRQVGPWTDVYSLGLTILAVAQRKDVNMGGSLVDAVDKRRVGPDLSPIHESLRPVLDKMLKPNPADRARSMEEVIQLLSGPLPGAAAPAGAKPAAAPKPKGEGFSLPPALQGKKGLAIGGGVAAAIIGGVFVTMSSGGDDSAPDAAATDAAPIAASADPAATARAALASGLASVPCTWLDVVNIESQGGNVGLAFRGVAGKPAEAQGQISRLLQAKGIQAGSMDFNDVTPIDARDCAPLEAFRSIRSAGTANLSVAQRRFEIGKLGEEWGGGVGAVAVIEVNAAAAGSDLSLIGLEENGTMTQIIPDKSGLAPGGAIHEVRPGVFRIEVNTDHKGWSGILMLSGKGPFDPGLLNGGIASRGAAWADRFKSAAQAKGWKTEMVWYRTVDDLPN